MLFVESSSVGIVFFGINYYFKSINKEWAEIFKPVPESILRNYQEGLKLKFAEL